MGEQANGHRSRRRILVAALLVAALALIGAVAAVVAPILLHRSAGGSGQTVPEGFVPITSADGADGRTRSLAVESLDGAPADLSSLRPGEVLVVKGAGFDPAIGIYVGICAVPERGEKPGPCLGGLPEGAMEENEGGEAEAAEPQTSVWITDDWAWRSFATQGYDEPSGEPPAAGFTARLLVAAPSQDNLDCTKVRCAVTTRADHTAAGDRVQDMQLPIAFAG